LLDEMFPQSVFAGNFRPGYRTRLAAKDWGLVRELAQEVGVPLGTCSSFEPLLEEAQRRGWSEDSVHGLVRLIEEMAGTHLRAAGAAQDTRAGEDDPLDEDDGLTCA
jgi:hypothetical protein